MSKAYRKTILDPYIPGECAHLGAGDSSLVLYLLPVELAGNAFEKLAKEVNWHSMFHRGGEVPRLVAVEGTVDEDGSYPIYRHPADSSPPLLPFSPTVSLIREHVQSVLHHPVNHVLIQRYRSGSDYISEHSDKTIDVVRGSGIVNVSIGAQRVMTLRLKKDGSEAPVPEGESVPPRLAQRFPLPHNSMFIMGPETNTRWLHGISTDNRPITIKSPVEAAEGGERISLTFRHIGTFLSENGKEIWGQGAKGKTKDQRQATINGGEEGAELIQAFGRENHESNFDWDAHYGRGFDVVHFSGSTV